MEAAEAAYRKPAWLPYGDLFAPFGRTTRTSVG